MKLKFFKTSIFWCRIGGFDYMGKGVMKAVNNVNNILAPEIIGFSVFSQTEIDVKMINLDGTANKSNLGANSILGISLAVAHNCFKRIFCSI